MKKKNNKQQAPERTYIVRKYISAKSASDAIRKDKTAPVDDVWLDNTTVQGQQAIGFVDYRQDES